MTVLHLKPLSGQERGDTRDTATDLPLDLRMGGAIDPGTDQDYFKIVLSQRTQFIIFTSGDLDTVGTLYGEDGDFLARNDDTPLSHGTTNFLITANLTADTYYLRVTSYDNKTGSYVLHTTTIPETTGIGNAKEIGLDSFENGIITPRGDVDYFKLVLDQKTDLIIRSSGLVYDTVGELLDSGGRKIAGNDDGDLPPSRQFLIRSELAAGTYYIKVRSFPYSRRSRRDVTGLYAVYVDTVTESGDTLSRSEEHTSELQSRQYLVCRLLLEKKKQ